MVPCIIVPVAIAKDDLLPKDTIREIIGTFFPKEWRTVGPETLVITRDSGYANTNCIVERPTPNGGPHVEPLKLFLKIHGDLDGEIEVFKHLVPTKHQEAQLCHDYGQAGLGPRVHGFFQTQDGTFGRIDEFLDVRNLKPEDVEDPIIRADVARGLAGFHSLATQLKKSPVQSYYDAITVELSKYHKMDKLKSLGNEGGVNIDDLVDYDFVSRIKQITGRLQSIGGKTGWCIHDVQFMNVLVKKSPREAESRVVLIDFEFVFQNYRAIDIGGHFMQKMFQWFDEESQIANCRPYTDEEKRHFCEEYAKRWNEATGDEDTREQLFMEAELGFLLAITFDIHNMFCFMDQDDDKDPLSLLALKKLFEEFVSQCGKLRLEG
ncbi:choline/ethanolamine kinase [Penicillium capsulatum]|uniref:Choline/ethanolamine kinase n=1 Tax=Penicillium capsulatum TaxID=69766 RepID=A0A9W9HNW9_9EURO|nr:choline/ethanolamine kinase [Penicillium capsulatum]KAJ6105424.1 choline/ethanolamine kinase [Penicillium capsulatum]